MIIGPYRNPLKERYINGNDWEEVYAWYPVKLTNGGTAWLEHVKRRVVEIGQYEGGKSWEIYRWEYRVR